jgi:membrane-bound lytic murein transglycosylase D
MHPPDPEQPPSTCGSPRIRPHSRIFRDLPRSIRAVFAGLVVLAAALVTLAWWGERDHPRPDSPFPVAEAAGSLLDTRLPMQVNERVEVWVQRFLTTHRPQMEEYLVRDGLYGDMIREKLRVRGMPQELIYLAMIESGLHTSAVSPAAASGVWQFLGATARSYGLVVDGWVDERRDPVRATDAALDYLEELHGEFGSWYLAAAAYNAGPARVTAALSRNGLAAGGEEAFYWEIIQHLPRETREYVPKLLAATLLGQQAEHFGLEAEPALPYLFDRVLVPGGTSLVQVARSLDAPPSLLRELNPHLIRGVTPPGRSFPVRVPQGESQRVVMGFLDGAPPPLRGTAD